MKDSSILPGRAFFGMVATIALPIMVEDMIGTPVVYFVMCPDEFEKMPVIVRHYRRAGWLHDITRDRAEPE